MKFSKQKMVDRLTLEGRADMIGDVEMAIMDNLDGQECDAICWARQVKGEPVYWVNGKDGKGFYVNEADCF